MRRTAWLMAALMVLALPLVGAAQTGTGSVTGTVTDPSGETLPGVTVTITNESTGAARSTVTDSAGRYDFANVVAGSYGLSFDLPGFNKQTTKVAVSAGQPVSLETKLELGQAALVEVTGTMIPRPTLEAMSPVTTMSVQELSYQGKTRLEDLLTSLPQIFTAQNSTVANGASGTATVNLRNLGAQRTLVLIDGRRMPTGDVYAVEGDLNFIPAALVKRVDILTGGASSVYGSDAVAGVVNFILDREFVGLKAGISPGGFQHNNNSPIARQINQARGFSFPTGSTWDGGQWDGYVALGGRFAEAKGHAAVYIDYRKTNALLKNTRDYTNCSVSALGATGPACGGSSTSPTGRFYTADGNSFTVDPATGNTFTPWASKYAFNYAVYNYMQRPDERWAGGGFLNYDWNKAAQAYAEVMLMDDRTDAQIAPSGDFGNSLTINCDNPMLSAQEYQTICANNGFEPHDIADLQIYRRNVEGGGRIDKLSHQAFRLVGGLKGELGKAWTYDGYGFNAQTRVPETYVNDFNTLNIQNALIVDGDPNNPSTWHCRDANAVAGGCVPWNIFKAGGVTQDAIKYLSLPMVSNALLQTRIVSGKVTGDLKNYGLAFPSATEGISIAVGSEYRKELIDYQTDLAYQLGLGAGQGSTTQPVTGSYDVKELFAETTIPFVQNARGAQNLAASLGYRYSNYSVNGGHASWKAEGVWAPSADVKVRAGFNRATRAPNVVELFQPNHLVLGGSTDPCSEANPEFTLAECQRMGVTAAQYGHIDPNPASQYNTHAGGNVNLEPEVGDTQSFGVVITPKGAPGFSAAVDYYDIKLKSTIGALGADDILKQCGLTGNPTLCSPVHRDQFGSLWRTPNGYTDAANQNVGKKRAQGLDINVTHVLPVARGSLNLNLIGSYLIKAEIDTGLYTYDCVGLTGNTCNDPYSDHPAMQPKWRHLFRASWEKGSLTPSVAWRMIGSVIAEQLSNQEALADSSMAEQLKLNLADKYGVFNYVDLAVSQKVGRGIRWTIGVNNIFDKNPPLGSGSTANDYADGFYGTYDSYGRFIHTSVEFTF